MTVGQSYETSHLGRLLRSWRKVRRVSQLELALKAGISSRHLSFVETGRAQASRAVVLQLAESLELPLRDQNTLLTAAGYAPLFTEGPLDGPDLEHAVHALESLIEKLEPYPAWVLDRMWNIHSMNRAAVRVAGIFVGRERLDALAAEGPMNLLRLNFSPDLLRPYIINWEVLAPMMLARVRRESMGPAPDHEVEELLEELLELADMPSTWRLPDPDVSAPPVIPIIFRKGELELEFITLVTTFGRPQDVLLQELWIEGCLPGNADTERFLQGLS